MSKDARPQRNKVLDRNDVVHIQHPDHCADDEHANERERHDGEDWTDVQPPLMLPPPSDPMAVARKFVEHCCLHNGTAGELTLRYWHGGWWVWRTTHWIEVEERQVRALLYAFTEYAIYDNGKNGIAPWLPTRKKIGDLLEALIVPTLLSSDVEQPCWLDDRDIVGPVVATKNGLLDISTRKLHPHSPLFFNMTSVPFAYDPDAPKPLRWLAFLDAVWSQEVDAIAVLGEWFGYIASGRLDLHKILLMVGPTRGGKGVIARVLSAMIGKRNVCGPTLNSLGGDFGLAPLIGKPLAIVSDARFVGKNSGIVVERLLSISGEDMLTINIKYKEQWTGKLSCRLHVISNELPRLGDASTAVIGRIVLLLLTRSWLGKEDHSLERDLCNELPGILNWALDGLSRLTFENGNRFTQVAAADEAVTAMRDLSSPVSAFVRERCEVGADKAVGTDALYSAYKSWCEENEHPKSPKQVFGRDLRAVVQLVRLIQSGTTPRIRQYVGLSLREGTDAADTLV
jgi:putative DNA primase/helicase